MSRGHGRVERAILAAFEADPDVALSSDELVRLAFPGVTKGEKKYFVSVIRAAKKLKRFGFVRGQCQGRVLVFYTRYNLMSYAMARLKAVGNYRTSDHDAELRALLMPGGEYHHCIIEGGEEWRDVSRDIAERDGDIERVKQLDAEEKAARAESLAMMLKGMAISAERGDKKAARALSAISQLEH